ncbi:MAG: hypothetical protein OXU61_01085 [Gammaproteobacteria bacterium]|nr:hypothetical protein [Gammaproteobacteria bacterium]
MTQANIELLHALKDAGATDELAEAAARSVAASGDVATKADIAALRAEMAAQEARLSWRLVGALGVGLAALAVATGWLTSLLT